MSLPFVVQTNVEKPGLEVRKFIRSHVMLGKNQGKSQGHMRRSKKPYAGNLADKSDAGQRLESTITASQTAIPPKVGSDLSTICLADAVEPCKIDVVLRCQSMFLHLSPTQLVAFGVFVSLLT